MGLLRNQPHFIGKIKKKSPKVVPISFWNAYVLKKRLATNQFYVIVLLEYHKQFKLIEFEQELDNIKNQATSVKAYHRRDVPHVAEEMIEMVKVPSAMRLYPSLTDVTNAEYMNGCTAKSRRRPDTDATRFDVVRKTCIYIVAELHFTAAFRAKALRPPEFKYHSVTKGFRPVNRCIPERLTLTFASQNRLSAKWRANAILLAHVA